MIKGFRVHNCEIKLGDEMMSNKKKDNFEFAVENIIRFGDTDIFPFPIENFIFKDMQKEIIDLLMKMDSDIDSALQQSPPFFYNMLNNLKVL